MATAGNITAVLTLNATKFNQGLESSLGAITKFQESISKFNADSKSMGTAIDTLFQHLGHLNNRLEEFNKNITNLSAFNQLSNAINKMANGLKILSSNTVDVEQGINVMNNIFKAWGQTLNGTEIKIKGVVTSLKEISNSGKASVNSVKPVFTGLSTSVNLAKTSLIDYGKIERQIYLEGQRQAENLRILQREFRNLALGVEQFNAVETGVTSRLRENQSALSEVALADQRVAQSKRQIASAMNQASVSAEKESVAHDKATQSINRQSTASKGLKSALSSLRMMGTMVGSMIAYNFVHNLAMATTETINAKSEMNGYFQMLGYTTSQTDRFNKALDETVKKFPRLNKYALGETISSIGVEFELTTKEMEKAMPVVSMITSEYLRAGRNVNEASLAVKDILQGEFQRLSRETGVKGEQLKEAGWSGDKSDVMGLLKALDKVGKDRNWDIFVTKANSLNDAVLIMQNRFSEWSADMVEKVQPSIVNAFNQIMVVANDFGKVVNKAIDWIMGDGLGQSIVKWGGLATAIVGVTGAFIHLRTGANLMQMAQMGLTKSIGASILGLEAEQVAQNGLRNSILMTVTGLKAEEIADMSRTKVLFASLLGLDMATVKEYGFTTALWSSITGVEAETIALEGLNAEMYVTIATVGASVGVVLAFTGVLVAQAVQISNTTEKYSKFVNILEKGDDIISEAKDTVDRLTNSKEALTEKLSTLEKGSYEYNVTANKLKQTQDELNTATNNYGDAVNSVAWVKHKQDLYDDAKAQAQLDAQKGINEALLDYGFNVQEAEQLSNQYWNDAINGWDQHYKTLQSVNEQYKKNEVSVESALQKLKELDDTKISPKEVEVLIRRKISAGNQVANAKEELGNATSLTEYVDKWLWLQVQQVQNALVDFDINNVASGLTDAIMGLAWGLVHFLGDNFIGQFTQGLAREWGLEGKGSGLGESIKEVIRNFDWIGTLREGFAIITNQLAGLNILDFVLEALSGSSTGSEESSTGKGSGSIAKSIDANSLLSNVFNIDPNSIWQWFDDNVKQPISDWWNGFISFDWLLGDTVSASDGSSDHPSIMQDISNIIGFDIQGWVESFNTDPLGTLGIEIPQIDILGLIQGLLPTGGENGGGFNLGQWLSDMFNIDGVVSYFTTNLSGIISSVTSTASTVSSTFSGLKSNIQGHLTGIATNVSTGFENAKNYANTKITVMRDSVKSVIDQMTGAWKSMKDSILDSAKLIYDGVKSKFDSVKNTLSDFFTKLQNPSQWGSAGYRGWSRQPKPQTARRLFSGASRSGGKHGAGINPYTSPSKKVKLSDLVDAVGGNKEVSVSDFLSMFSEGGFGAWSFHKPSKTHIFNKGKEWKSAPANIQGIGSVGDGYKVARFWDGKPSFSFDEFLTVAEAIFSAIPYKFYYDSDWKGNWVSALLSGALNCSDGADALLALASIFGFSGEKIHTNLSNGTGHFYTRINGKTMDTTNFQNHGSWGALGGAGSPTRSRSVGNSTTQNINITITGDVYGEEDFISKVREGAREVMREEFNDPYTIAL